jgi:mannose-6-phosphate isomerase-like protein (cupin superfamily)
MQKVSVDEIEPTGPGGGDLDRRGLSDPLGTTDMAINRYALAPGEGFSGGMHSHLDQEEVFLVIEGTATFETKPEATAESETVEVSAGEAIRFAPGEFQQGRNESDGEVVALAMGAPRESTEGRVPQPCPACGESDVMAVVMGDGGMMLECPECGEQVQPEM